MVSIGSAPGTQREGDVRGTVDQGTGGIYRDEEGELERADERGRHDAQDNEPRKDGHRLGRST